MPVARADPSSSAVAAAPAAAPAKNAKSAPQRAMEKLGLLRDIDLALHLPLRYEDETRITRLADAHDGQTVQVEGRVTDSRTLQRGRQRRVVGDGLEARVHHLAAEKAAAQLAAHTQARAGGERLLLRRIEIQEAQHQRLAFVVH